VSGIKREFLWNSCSKAVFKMGVAGPHFFPGSNYNTYQLIRKDCIKLLTYNLKEVLPRCQRAGIVQSV
jgi:hypothetical protein